MSNPDATVRTSAYAQHAPPSLVDRFGVWLSARRINRTIGNPAGKAIVDLGCGYQARYSRTVIPSARRTVLSDVALAPDLAEMPNVTVIEGALPQSVRALDAAGFDVVLCMSVLEHVADPAGLLAECRRLLAPDGVCIVNVPTWLGKRFLELAAFRLRVAPFEEMDDHKRYYDPRDLWPMLVAAGFKPHEISCRRHKFGLNTVAVCRTGRA